MTDSLERAAATRREIEAERDQAAAERGRVAAERDRIAAERGRVEAELGAIRERYYYALARLPGGARPTDAELIHTLQAAGVPVTAADRVTLHVGFAHSATTSLQADFFPARDDLYYPGLPYAEAGGFFSYLKYTEDHILDPDLMLRLCRDCVYGAPGRRDRPVVVSDETLTEPAEVYYHAHVLPGPQVAARLKRYFPTARVGFTTRRQPDYVASMYFNIKRNHAFLAGMPVPPFDEWWHGTMRTQARGPYLLNLDYAPLVRVYAELFGRENVLVLPLEELTSRGPRAYLGRLCDFLGVPLRDADLDRFQRPRNGRMSVVEALAAELLAARHHAAPVREALSNEALAGLAGQAAPTRLDLSSEVAAEIHSLTAPGNRWLAETFGLPLGEWGYPV